MLINRDNFKFRMGIFFFIFTSFLIAQETHNLEVIWEKGIPLDTLFFTYGSELSSGDFNGDGYSDIVVDGESLAAPLHYSDKAYIFLGGPQFDTIPDVVIESDTTWGFTRIKGIGDVNADGFDDLALGGSLGPNNTCMLYIFLGGDPIDTICDFRMRGGGAFGYTLGSGDVNGDSYSDLIIGAMYAAPMPGGYYMGKVHINFGGPNFDSIIDLTLNGGHEGDQECFGSSVSSGGDVNHDGYEDIIIGAYNFGINLRGRIYVYLGGNPMDTIYDVAMSGLTSMQQLGRTGVDFLINPTKDNAIIGGYGLRKQEACVLFGGSEMDSIPDVLLTTEGDSSYLTPEAVNAGFTSRSEVSDALVGSSTEYHRKGTAYLWLGGELLDSLPDAWIRGAQPLDEIGWRVASAGDVNGDGKDEIMVSNYAAHETPERVWVCKYTGPGIEERQTLNANSMTLEIKPNPAKSVILVRCSLPVKSIKVYDINGRIVKTLDVGKMLESRQLEIKWDLSDDNQRRVATGVYFIEITDEDKIRIIKKITLVK